MPRHATEDYARLKAGLAATNTGRLATEIYADGLFGVTPTGQDQRLATEDYVDQLVINPPQTGEFVDTFTRQDFASLGGDWIGMASGEFGITASQATPGVDTYCVSIRYLGETSGNHRATVRVGALGAVGGPIVRAPDSLGVDLGTTEGFYIFTVTGANSDILAIRKHVPFASVMTQLGALVTGTPVSPGDSLRLDAEGDTLRGYLNGLLVITRTDATIPDTNVRTGMYANQTLLLRFSRFESSALDGVNPPPPPVITAPGAPTGVTASLLTGVPAAATVSWAAPASTGGSPILGYRILVSPGGRQVDVGNVLTRQIDGLTAGTSYTFTVSARNTVGYGSTSAASNSVVPTAPVEPPPTSDATRYYDLTSTFAAVDAATTAGGIQSAMDAFGTAYGVLMRTPATAGGTDGISWQAYTSADLPLLKTNVKMALDEFAKYPPEFVLATILTHYYLAKNATFDSNGAVVGGVTVANGTKLIITNNSDPLYHKGATQHEFGHCIHRSITEWETEWATYNPPGFVYQSLDLQPSYSGTHPVGFMSNYARSNIVEDFAETHMYMISNHLFEQGKTIRDSDTRVASKVAELRTKMGALDSRVGLATFYRDATIGGATGTEPPPVVPPSTAVFRAGNWWERPLPSNAPVHPSNRNFLSELNGTYAVNGITAADNGKGGPVNAQGDRYIALVGGVNPTPSPALSFDTPIYKVSGGTSYILTKLQGAGNVPPEFLAATAGGTGEGIRIPEVAKQHFLLGGAQSSDSPMLVIDTARGYYANLAKAQWNASLGRWEIKGSTSTQAGGAASIYYTSSYGHGGRTGWPASLVQYDDDSRNSGFRGNNPMTRVIEYARMVAEGKIPYVTELFAVRTAAYNVFPLTGFENDKGGLIGEGVRLRLKPSLTDATIQSRLAATLTGNRLTQAVMIAKAWRDYGCVVGDNSGSGSRVKLESFHRCGATNLWDVDEHDLKTFDFNPDTGDWVFIADEYFPPASGTTDTTPPVAPTIIAVNETSTSATVTWSRVSDAANYKVYKDNVLVNTTTTLTYTDTAVTEGATYTYKVSAVDAAGNESVKSAGAIATIPSSGGDTTAPTVPSGLTATAVSDDQINLAWNASTDAVGVVSYRVRRAGALIATVSGTSYQNTGLTASTAYSYTVAAVDAAGNQSALSGSASATTEAVTTGGPTPGVPPNVTAYMTSDTMVTVKFSRSTGTTAAKTYKVYRSAAGGGAATILVGSNTPPDVVSNGAPEAWGRILTATGLAASTLYSFAVSAVSATGSESAKSATQNATTAAAKASPVGNVQVAYIAGDIAIGGIWQPNCMATGDLIRAAADKNFVIAVGDNAYSIGSIANYRDIYAPAWGSFKAITYPCVGNHETPPAYDGYKWYFGNQVPTGYPSYYSFVKGNWLFLSLDSNATGTNMTNQANWLQTTLAGRAASIKGICAFFHHPRHATSPEETTVAQPLIDELGAHGTDVVLQAHCHHYERFAKLNAAGAASSTGMRFFVVGTGGSGTRGMQDTAKPNSEQIIGGDQRGVLRMAFADNGYSWDWVGAPDAIWADTGSSTTTKPNPSTGDDSGFNLVNPK